MPTTYQAPRKSDNQQKKTVSQSTQSNFAAGTATVQNIITNKGDDVFSISPQDTLGKAVELLSEKRIGALVVSDTGVGLLGILSERDIVRKLAETPGRTLPHKVEQVMTSNVEVCTRDEALVSVLRRMTDGRFRHMPVVENEKLVGVVTIGDVVNYRLNELEYEALQLKQLVVG
ncbi:inosine-5-monophosphate dehydrogenase [Kiloniella spongiae]|uniref:Inosine-5-monophosphate dehydrogenase n=1 Tax=Kiloniella spongiae TaxID=1489064 RepID=A0A0H2MK03_9PROT|nr:CBS domain-containing protein [Kiloniella spongiae]KLN61077.1 inosine-5-monophosphate dehydrogenase [Kiloniella spongiae]